MREWIQGLVAVGIGAVPGLIMALLGGLGIIDLNPFPVDDRTFNVIAGLGQAGVGGFLAASSFSGRVREDI
ncbi:MAG: hypothetical protein WBV82_17755 [Myxococcaceae bacterium]